MFDHLVKEFDFLGQ